MHTYVAHRQDGAAHQGHPAIWKQSGNGLPQISLPLAPLVGLPIYRAFAGRSPRQRSGATGADAKTDVECPIGCSTMGASRMCGIVGLFLKDKSLRPELGRLTAAMLHEMRGRRVMVQQSFA